jgi:NAD(P)H-hydrate epimerase
MAHAVRKVSELDPLLKKASVIAIGPGLGQSSWSRALFARTLESGLPLVIDADGLNLLAADPEKNDNWILTPHPGEAGRLLSCSSADIQVDRFTATTKLQQEYAGVCVLKGCGTLVADHKGEISVCSAGNPGMASGGMGDVLSGVIAGLLAQGFTLDQAAITGVCIHAEAADRAAKAGERGLLATDLMPWLRQLVNPV